MAVLYCCYAAHEAAVVVIALSRDDVKLHATRKKEDYDGRFT